MPPRSRHAPRCSIREQRIVNFVFATSFDAIKKPVDERTDPTRSIPMFRPQPRAQPEHELHPLELVDPVR